MACSATLSQLIDILAAKGANLSDAALAKLSHGIQTDTRILKPGEVF